MIQYMRRGLVAISFATALCAAPDAFIGASNCAPCHPEQARKQAASSHAGALAPVANHPLTNALPSAVLMRGAAYRFTYLPDHRIRIRDATDVMELPLEWAFGKGRQAVTFVTRVDREWYVEHYATYYPRIKAFGATPGQDAVKPRTLPEAAGVLYRVNDPDRGIANCFECHSTGPVSFDSEGRAVITEPGVKCEACHGPGSSHAANPTKVKPRNPARMTAAKMNEFCGKCHRPPASAGVKIDWNYAWNVRHQPVYLSESKCFQRSNGKLSCLTCHDPHAPEVKPIAAYNKQCADCHNQTKQPPKTTCTANCIDCHMPLVSPQPALRFTNHWIGVYREGAKLKPIVYQK